MVLKKANCDLKPNCGPDFNILAETIEGTAVSIVESTEVQSALNSLTNNLNSALNILKDNDEDIVENLAQLYSGVKALYENLKTNFCGVSFGDPLCEWNADCALGNDNVQPLDDLIPGF